MLCILCLGLFSQSFSQRSYKSSSVLSSGEWYKLAVDGPGVYRIDLPFLKKLGINNNSIPSSSIRMFGNGGEMLSEACSAPLKDDLLELAIWIQDGGDGSLNGNDYILFYAPGPHHWLKDSLNRSFTHQKNLYSESSFYYLTLGGAGKRILQSPPGTVANTIVSAFDERYFHELDTINFLGSGKRWYGEEFANSPGRVTNRSFNPGLAGIIPGQTVRLKAEFIARSVGSSSRFNLRINGQGNLQIDVPATGNLGTDPFAKSAKGETFITLSQSALNIGIDFTPGGFNAQGWLDWFEVFLRRNLDIQGSRQLHFRDWNSVGPGNVAEFRIQNAAPAMVWEVTELSEPRWMRSTTAGTQLNFVNDCQRLREYVAFNSDSALQPSAIGKIINQNLHSAVQSEMLIITAPSLVPEANRLALHHLQKDNLRSLVVVADQVFNEFSSGNPDPSAIRDFVKMYYDRAGVDTTKRPQYLLLFGDGSFDPKNRIEGNTNLVPVYESENSLDPLLTYTSDDFFGYLDDSDDINDGNRINLLDIGIGRIPAKTQAQAKAFVDKLIAYTSTAGLGPWRNNLNFIADDEDFNLHLHDAEIITETVKSTNSNFDPNKIYLDAYQQVSEAGGTRYPKVNQLLQEELYNGMLVLNYTGHGGFRRLAEEVVLDQEIINAFNNAFKLPLFVTATCDFAPYDDPRIHSIGEDVLLRPKTGAIALMTTTRLVFAFSNRIMNQNYLQTAMMPKADGSYNTLGEAVKLAKNYTYQTFGDIVNNRKFTLLGDPALRIAFPIYRVNTLTINGKPVSTSDTLQALEEYEVEGVITDGTGAIQNSFNGNLHVSVYDKEQSVSTLANDADSYKESFRVQRNLVFKGKAKVSNGKFIFNFIVPKDINYQFGAGKIYYYAENGAVDGNGSFSEFVVGGSGSASLDNEGPDIKAYLNNETFINGSETNESPVLILKLQDSSGINILGTGIGHDLIATLDNEPDKSFILNRFYESDLDNYRKGNVRYQLPKISEGNHVLKIKAWDVANNSNEMMLEFLVRKKEDLSLSRVLNYPNPFTTKTSFWFEHNHPFEQLKIHIQVFTVSGKLVKTLSKSIFSEGTRVTDLEWDGTDDFGDKLARGVYIYILRVRTSDGKQTEKIEKLVIL